MSTLLVPVFSLCLIHQHHCSPSELVVNSVKAPQGEDWWKGGSRSGQSLSWSVQTQKTWPLASANQRRCLWGRTWHERKEKVAVYMGTWRRWSRSGFTYGRYSLMSDGQDKTCGGGRWRGKEKNTQKQINFSSSLSHPRVFTPRLRKRQQFISGLGCGWYEVTTVAPWPVCSESFKSTICRKEENMKWKQEWEQIKPERERGEEGVQLAGEWRRGDEEMRWGYVTAKRASRIWKGMGDKTLTEQKKKSSTVSSTTHLEETERHNKSCKRSKQIKRYQTKKENEWGEIWQNCQLSFLEELYWRSSFF